MTKPNELFSLLDALNDSELVTYLMQHNFIKNEANCSFCGVFMNLRLYAKNKDKYAWRCCNSLCSYHNEYFSIRINSFFEGFKSDIRFIFQVLIKYLTRTQTFAIVDFFRRDKAIIFKIISEFKSRIPAFNYEENKLGGPGVIVQIDETMLNYKCKSHRGRSATNKTDAISIVEVGDRITRAFARVIPNKESNTLIPIIVSQVAANSTIWTDEHRSYGRLSQLGFNHGSVCHKYEFVNRITGVNTQAVESFHNSLKTEIKKRKGVETEKRDEFLKEFLFFFNFKELAFEKGIELIKLN